MEPDLMILEKLIAVAIWMRRTLVLLICFMEGNLGHLVVDLFILFSEMVEIHAPEEYILFS